MSPVGLTTGLAGHAHSISTHTEASPVSGWYLISVGDRVVGQSSGTPSNERGCCASAEPASPPTGPGSRPDSSGDTSTTAARAVPISILASGRRRGPRRRAAPSTRSMPAG